MIIGLGLVALAILTLGMEWGWNPRRALRKMEVLLVIHGIRREMFEFAGAVKRMHEAMNRVLANAVRFSQQEMIRAMGISPADLGEKDNRTFHGRIGNTAV